MTRRIATGRSSAPVTGPLRRPAHLAPRRHLLHSPASLAGSLGTFGSSIGRLGLAATLGCGLVAGAAGSASAVAGPRSAVAAPAVAPVASVSFTAAATTSTAATTAAATTPAAAARAAAVRRALVIRIAKRYVGVRYRYGGTTPAGFDCSGYVRYVHKRAGKWLPRTSRAQYAYVHKISRASARPGDLVFFRSSSGRVFHVGIYAGHNTMYDSPRPGRRVGLHTIWSKNVRFGRV